MKLSIHITSVGRLDLLKTACRSVADALPAESEVLVVINGHHPAVVKWMEEMKHPAFRAIAIEGCTPAAARNRTIPRCQGEIIAFLEESVVVPRNHFFEVLEEFEGRPYVSVVGGPVFSGPEASLGGRIRAALATPRSQSFNIHNLSVRRSRISDNLKFRETLGNGFENQFIQDCLAQIVEVKFLPKLALWSATPGRISEILVDTFVKGTTRGAQMVLEFSRTSLSPAVPALGWVLLFAAILSPIRLVAVPALIAASLALNLGRTLSSPALREFGLPAILASGLRPLKHLAYGLGFWKGCFEAVLFLPSGVARPLGLRSEA